MTATGRPRLLVPLALILATPAVARADGGAVRTRQSVGSFVVTVFTTPTPLTAGPADVSVMVQQRASLAPLLDARVRLLLIPPDGQGHPGGTGPPRDPTAPRRTTSVLATGAHATNKLLYAASVLLPSSGRWRLRVSVEHAGRAEHVECVLPVGPSPPRLLAFWPWLVLPFLGVGLAALNGHLTREQRASRRHR